MIAVAWSGVLLMVASIALSIVARRRLWGLRLAPPTPSSSVPQGSVLLAARSVRGVTQEVTPLLADWQARGVLEVRQEGQVLTMGGGNSVASGPEWHFTVADASRVDAVELPLLQIFVPGAPARGATSVLVQSDTKTRDRILDGVHAAIVRQRDAFGPKPRTEALAGVGLIALSVVASLAAVAGAAIAGAGAVPIALAFMGGLITVVTVALLCGRAQRPSDAERRYRQDVLNLGAWLPGASPDARLAGWAMVWNLPGEWATGLPSSITSLRARDRDFLRGDFAQRLPQSVSL